MFWKERLGKNRYRLARGLLYLNCTRKTFLDASFSIPNGEILLKHRHGRCKCGPGVLQTVAILLLTFGRSLRHIHCGEKLRNVIIQNFGRYCVPCGHGQDYTEHYGFHCYKFRGITTER